MVSGVRGLMMGAGLLTGLCVTATVGAAEDSTALLDLSLAELINLPVTTASRKAESRDQTPAHIMVVTREQIRERRYKNLADLLEDMPGVDFQRGTKTSQFNQFSVQGSLGPNRLLVLMDGVRISHPGGSTYPVAENLALYPARQVEFLYGPAAALYGADAVSGVVNIITDAGNGEDGNRLSLGAGNFNSREGSFMAGTGDEGRFKLALGGHWQESDRARLDKRYPSYFNKVDIPGLSAAQRERYRGEQNSYSLFSRLDIEDWLTLGYYRHHFTNLTSTVDTYATTRYSDKARWITTSDTLYSQFRFELSENLQSGFRVEYSRIEVDPKSHYNNTYSNFQPGYSYSFAERIAAEQNFDWRISDRHQMQAGLGLDQKKAIEIGSMPRKYSTGSSPSGQGLIFPGTTDLNMPVPNGTRRTRHLYGQLLSSWSDSFSTTLGMRLDHHTRYGSSYNPRLGAVWKPADKHLFKLTYGRAFREPSSEESLQYYGSFDGTVSNGLYEGQEFRVPNEDLKPERARSVGLVWEWRPTHDLNLVTNLYHSRVTGLIVTRYDMPDDTSFVPGAILKNPSAKVNAGRQRQMGLDLAVQWRYYLSPDWQGDLWGSAGWIHGRINEGDGVDWKIPYVSKYRFKLGTTLRYQDRLTLTSKLRWMGSVTNGRTKQPGSNQPPASCNKQQKAPNRCATPGYLVTDLHLGWHGLANEHMSLWLDIYNLANTRYYAAAGSGSGTFWDMPQQPRSWILSTEWRF